MIQVGRENSKYQIGVFFPWAMLDSVPSLRNAVILLAQQGYHVEIYTKSGGNWESPCFLENNISLVTLSKEYLGMKGKSRFGVVGIVLRRIYKWTNAFLRYLSLHDFRIQRAFARRHASKPYKCFIGVDPEGLLEAGRWSRRINVPLIYYSLELLFSEEIKTRRLMNLKRREIQLSHGAMFTITQDEKRAEALMRENGLLPKSVITVPNAPMGCARIRKANYLREKFDISEDQKIMLCAGYLEEWAMSRELVNAASSWPDGYILVMHSRTRVTNNPYVQSLIKESDSSRVKFSLDPVPYDKYFDLVESADVGLAFYKQLNSRYDQKNLALMGLSSGKLASYLYCGLPVVVNNFEGPRQLVDSYECGLCVSNPYEIKEVLKRIFDNYEFYSGNAVRCFNERLEFGQYFSKVIESIKQF